MVARLSGKSEDTLRRDSDTDKSMYRCTFGRLRTWAYHVKQNDVLLLCAMMWFSVFRFTEKKSVIFRDQGICALTLLGQKIGNANR
jgi:hypothetical protein